MCPEVTGSALVTLAACPVPSLKSWHLLGWQPQLPAATSPGFGWCIQIQKEDGKFIVHMCKYIYIKGCSSPLSTEKMPI